MTCIVFMYVLYSYSEEDIRYRQNFIRSDKTDLISSTKFLPFPAKEFYIAGLSDSTIFFGEKKEPLRLYGMRISDLKNRWLIDIDTHDLKSQLKKPQIKIDSPYFYILDGQSPALLRGYIKNWEIADTLQDQLYFRQSQPISANKIIIYTTSSKEGEKKAKNVLGIYNIKNKSFNVNHEALEPQKEEYYSTFGSLKFCKELNKIVFTYSFRNAYHILDTNLSILSKGKTIDTISQVRIKPAKLTTGNMVVAPSSSLVNGKSQIYGTLLFIESYLKGSETRSRFDTSSVIDIYDINQLAYKGSLYIPDHNNSKMEDFAVDKDVLVALFDKESILYTIDYSAILASKRLYEKK